MSEKRRAQQAAACRRWRAKAFKQRPELVLYYNAKQRAVAFNLLFDITPDDIRIPETCPVLGIPLVRGTKKLHAGSPSLDRYNPNRGYIRGNIAVISHRANTIKQDATADELQAVANWLRTGVRNDP